MPGIVYTEGSNRVVRHYVPEGQSEPNAAWFSTQFPGVTLTKRTLAADQVLSGGKYPVGRVASASTTAATLSDATLTTSQQNAITAGARRRQMRQWLRDFYDSGLLDTTGGVARNGIDNLLIMVAIASSHDSNLIARWQFINSFLDLTPGDIIKDIDSTSWTAISPFGPSGTQFHTFNTSDGTATAASATFFMTGNVSTFRSFVL